MRAMVSYVEEVHDGWQAYQTYLQQQESPAGGISSTVFVGTSQKLVNLMMVNIYDMLKNKTLYTHTHLSVRKHQQITIGIIFCFHDSRSHQAIMFW